jgi:hypothetical protein
MYFKELETSKTVKRQYNENQGKNAAERLAKIAARKRTKKLHN